MMKGRRVVLAALGVLALAACDRPNPKISGREGKNGSSGELVAIGAVQQLHADLVEQLNKIRDAVAGKDKGVDSRAKICVDSLGVVDFQLQRAKSLTDVQASIMFQPFLTKYADLVSELDAEGLRRDGLVQAGERDAAITVPTELELRRVVESEIKEAAE